MSPSWIGYFVTRSPEGSQVAAGAYNAMWNSTRIPLQNGRYKWKEGIVTNTLPHWPKRKLKGQKPLTQQVWQPRSSPNGASPRHIKVDISDPSSLTNRLKQVCREDEGGSFVSFSLIYAAMENKNSLWEFLYHFSSLSLLGYTVDYTLITNSSTSPASVPFALRLHSSSHEEWHVVPHLIHLCGIWPHDLLWTTTFGRQNPTEALLRACRTGTALLLIQCSAIRACPGWLLTPKITRGR